MGQFQMVMENKCWYPGTWLDPLSGLRVRQDGIWRALGVWCVGHLRRGRI